METGLFMGTICNPWRQCCINLARAVFQMDKDDTGKCSTSSLPKATAQGIPLSLRSSHEHFHPLEIKTVQLSIG